MWHFQRSKLLFNMGLFLSCAAMLSGCGELNSQFTCPMKPGVTCQSLDQVNTMVDQGKLGEVKLLSHSDPVLTVSLNYSTDPVTRSPEQVMRLWIAPYQDNRGNYYSSTLVYHVIQTGHWSMESSVKDSAHV